MRCVQNFVPNIEVEALLRLELDIDEEVRLPLVWLVATVFSAIWQLRLEKKQVQLFEVRAELEAKINLLRETRYSGSAIKLDELVENFFC